MNFGLFPRAFKSASLRQRIDDDPVRVQLHAHQFRAELAEPVQRALVTVFLGQHGIAGVQQQAANHVDALAGPGGDQDVLYWRRDAPLAPGLVGNEPAQPGIALRPESEAIDRQPGPLAPQHRGGRFDQALHRDLLGVVVAADEVILRERRPARRRVGQAFTE
jgi:hypothetical protein